MCKANSFLYSILDNKIFYKNQNPLEKLVDMKVAELRVELTYLLRDLLINSFQVKFLYLLQSIS